MNQATAVRQSGQGAIDVRLDASCYPENGQRMLSGESVRYEVAARERGVVWGGLGVLRQLVKRLQVAKNLDAGVQVLKRHFPYHVLPVGLICTASAA